MNLPTQYTTKKRHALLALAMGALVSTAAYAAVTFDPTTGEGFVGKGDVQLAFGWNNAKLQANAGGISFTYAVTNNYDAVCTWVTGPGGKKTHNVPHTKKDSVTSAIAYDARTRNQITGFILNGYGDSTEVGAQPVVGGPCPGNNGHEGTWSSVTPTGSSGGLYVNYSTDSVLIWP